MNVQYINPFVLATKRVFSTMFKCELSRGELYVKQGLEPSYEVNGIIDLSGKATGTVVLSLSREVALAAASAMLGEPTTEINHIVRDAVGELTNMIAGNAKACLEILELRISLPKVVIGTSEELAFPEGGTPIGIPFDGPLGRMVVDVGLVENATKEIPELVS